MRLLAGVKDGIVVRKFDRCPRPVGIPLGGHPKILSIDKFAPPGFRLAASAAGIVVPGEFAVADQLGPVTPVDHALKVLDVDTVNHFVDPPEFVFGINPNLRAHGILTSAGTAPKFKSNPI